MSATTTSNPRASVSVESLDKKAVNVQATEVFDDIEAQKPSKQPTQRKSANVTESLTKDPKYWRIATITGIVGGLTCNAVGESKVIVGGDNGPPNDHLPDCQHDGYSTQYQDARIKVQLRKDVLAPKAGKQRVRGVREQDKLHPTS